MLLKRSALDLVELIKLSLEDNEFSAFLSVQVHGLGLDHLEGVGDLEEVLLLEEEVEVSLSDFLLQGLQGDHHSLLIEILLEGIAGVVLQPKRVNGSELESYLLNVVLLV